MKPKFCKEWQGIIDQCIVLDIQGPNYTPVHLLRMPPEEWHRMRAFSNAFADAMCLNVLYQDRTRF